GVKFLGTGFTALAGSALTITLDNQDTGVAHDFVLFDPSGTKIGETEVANGPSVNSTTITLGGPGKYSFMCSVHPTQMKGSITVQ
ncbi:MAG TPA: cupredoxin domain-containing protein, partial [Dehalococcoidia bacterium]